MYPLNRKSGGFSLLDILPAQRLVLNNLYILFQRLHAPLYNKLQPIHDQSSFRQAEGRIRFENEYEKSFAHRSEFHELDEFKWQVGKGSYISYATLLGERGEFTLALRP